MNNKIYTKKASISDLNNILEIELSCFGTDAFSKKQMKYLIEQAKGLFLIAQYNNTTVGYISFLINSRHNIGRIYSIAINSEYQKNGIGGTLLDKIIEYAIVIKLNSIFLEVRTDNISAISIYEKKGFTKHLEKTNYYNDGANAYSMVLRF